MPCERKHIEAIRSALGDREASNIGYVAAVGKAISAALAACDERPCVWTETSRGFGPFNVAGCVDRAYGNDHGFTYCPHCGRKIAPLPAAPEEKP